MTRSLGQVAYEAFFDVLSQPPSEAVFRLYPEWQDDPVPKDAWQAAAEAVAIRCDLDWAEDRELHKAERAVIEAAKAWLPIWASEMDDLIEYIPECRAFKEAVEALQELEGE